MINPHPPIDPQAAWLRIMEQEQARSALAAQALQPNKDALFAPLRAAGITALTVTFDGCGDSGQIEMIDARRGDAGAELPDTHIELLKPIWDGSALETRQLPVRDALETLCFMLLGQTHSGWELNEGAYGDFSFDVATGSIALDYHERIETSEYHGHEW